MNIKALIATSFAIPLLSASFVQADDTEIYGAGGLGSSQGSQPNIMFIMDTSQSMTAAAPKPAPYDPNTTYPRDYNRFGSFDPDRFYLKENGYYSFYYEDGIPLSALSTVNSTDCEDTISEFNTKGFSQGKFSHLLRNGKWDRDLNDGSNLAVRCDTGKSDWIYSGNYLNYQNTRESSDKTQFDVVKTVLNDILDVVDGVNFGLMRFDTRSDGGMIDVPVKDIDETRPLIKSKLDAYTMKGGTPLTETLTEAVRYFRGSRWNYGYYSSPNRSVSSSVENNIINKNSNYISPITESCQKNHIILLTDGQPSNDTGQNTVIQNLIKDMTLPEQLDKDCTGSGNCLDEFSYWLNQMDHSDKPGLQNITLHTIGGFGITSGVELLQSSATMGGGNYYTADDGDQISDALVTIFDKILSQNTTFTAPAVSVNAFNSSEHRDELYYALFRPENGPKWQGNLKRYRIRQDGVIVDKDDDPAIDVSTGFFSSEASDFWNTLEEPDGKNVELGGFANLLDASQRSVYSETSTGDLAPFENVATSITLNVNTTTEEEKLKKWVLGYDVDNTNPISDYRYSIGDPLHSEPVVVTYGGTKDNPDATIFFGSNEGFLHAVDTDTGKEQFAFLPTDLHKNQDIYYENTIKADDRPYGIDGHVTSWLYDINNNNVAYDENGVLDTGEHVYVYAGMRRGGRNYYALDVTDRNNPELLFKIEGGTGDFQTLGQTWSKMTIAKVKYNGAERFVAFFTGGYDTNQDSNTTREDDVLGNAVYMVDAKTGERLWWASDSGADLNIPDMRNSIPASLSVIDINSDGLVDYLYAADTGGRIFRIDLNIANNGATDFAEGGMIAQVGGSAESNNQRFYYRPSVALVENKSTGNYLTIAIGTGHRAGPVSTTAVNNRFYVIKDRSPYAAPATYQVKTEESASKVTLSTNESPDPLKIYNASALMTQGETALSDDMRKIMREGGGWYVELTNTAEKVLSPALTFAGAVLFNTYSPEGGYTNNCGANTGTSRSYVLDQRMAMSVIDLNNDGSVDASDSTLVLKHSGIAPRPVIVYRKDGGKSITVGTETINDDRFGDDSECGINNCNVTPNYWRQNN